MSLSKPRVVSHDRFARIVFDDGRHADFHWIWLRHECALDRHPTTGERTLCSSRISPDLRAQYAWIDGDALHVRWTGERAERAASRYPLGWLREHAYAPDRDDVEPARTLAELETTLVGNEALLPPDWAERLARDGALIARHPTGITGPEHTERLVDQIAAEGLTLISTHFGRIEDLRTDNTTNQNTDQLGYTDAPIDLHTDQPFLDAPPRYQLLHGIQPADEGGESLVSDARRAARWLEQHDVETFRVLTRTPVRFHRKQKAFERLFTGPILDVQDDRFQVRLSPFTMAPHRLPFAEMEAWYRAYGRFVRLVEQRAVRTTLRAGDVLLYDNHRMLHARTGFRGARWVRGVYFDRGAR
ncbi:TauD/TfdA family dioxygenase [Sandaracinus amylolyticus]|uniref:TauD/TfdA family dioxygenase n=1 Tax=Sandaracinus amylolyticus TaxID=927083 RepID=UPI001F2C00DB|nr:TauD/TfdA family dioxygenase [Sandaracinus amylolyticus]UJR81757.1 Gamma-butyrobetaine dioxygenase/trimethyllysine dioxygenase [Sandaracinus amylolyticus]